MNHYVYLITNNINGMKYIGKRSCNGDIENDPYMGGGTKLKEAQKEYGINNFSKKILALAFDEAMAFELENYYIKKLMQLNQMNTITKHMVEQVVQCSTMKTQKEERELDKYYQKKTKVKMQEQIVVKLEK